MAIIFLDRYMDEGLKMTALSLAKPYKYWKVNDNITAFQFELKGYEENEPVIAQYFTTIKQKLKFRRADKSLVTWKS